MVSESRKLLDEQIASLKALRLAAGFTYTGLAALPALSRQSQQTLVSHLARLVVAHFEKLRNCLASAEHWLGHTDSIYVPVPLAEGEYKSACEGAEALLQQVAVLAGCECDYAECLPTDSDKLEKALEVRFREGGIPIWISDAPVETLTQLASVVTQETNDAISRLTREFHAASPPISVVTYDVNGVAHVANDAPVDNEGEAIARVLAVADPSAARIIAVADDGALSVEERMQAICEIDVRFYGKNSPQWATLLGTSASAIRNTHFWRVDRKKYVGEEIEKFRELHPESELPDWLKDAE